MFAFLGTLCVCSNKNFINSEFTLRLLSCLVQVSEKKKMVKICFRDFFKMNSKPFSKVCTSYLVKLCKKKKIKIIITQNWNTGNLELRSENSCKSGSRMHLLRARLINDCKQKLFRIKESF